MIRIDGRTWLVWAAWILLLPIKWLICATVAACVHEIFHIICISIVGGKIQAIIIGPAGVVIETNSMSGYGEVICALAGPLGSLFLVFLIYRFPILGFCGLVHGVFNLLPVYPLDGGRAVKCLMACRGTKIQ